VANTKTDEQKFNEKKIKEHNDSVNDQLAKLAGGSLKINELFRDRTDGQQYVEKPPTMSLEDLVNQGSKIIKANAQMVDFTKEFKARPNDGAVAFARVLTDTYGLGAVGKTIPASFFSPEQRPEYKTVTVGLNPDGTTETIEVPWGLMEFSPLHAQFNLYYNVDADYGFNFVVAVTAPKKMQQAINGLFMLVENYLKHNSIYRNKALYGVGRANPKSGEIIEPEFIDAYKTDREKIVYSQAAWHALRHAVLGRIEHADLLRQANVPLGNKVLLHGENGTGKTEFCNIAGQIALENGWGYIRSRWDEDIAKVVAFAERLGTPTLVTVEDVEKLMQRGPQEMDKLLDLFDGAGAKGREVMLLLTSNHIDELTKSMTRAGRIDRMIHISSLDREGVERLINVTIPAEQRENVDYDALHAAYDGYSPAWIMEALKGVKVAAIVRTGELGAKLSTEDFVVEAQALREAHDTHQRATDRPVKDQLGSVLGEVLAEVVDERLNAHIVDFREDGSIKIKQPA